MGSFEERQRQYTDVDEPSAKKKYIAEGIRKKFADRFAFDGMSDQEVIQRHYARFGKGLEPEAYGKKLEEVYGPGYTAPEAPKETLGEKVQGAADVGKEFVQGIVPFVVPEVPKAVAALAGNATLKGAVKGASTKIPIASQIGFLGAHAINAGVNTGTAAALQKTISDIPVPDIEATTQQFFAKLHEGLAAKGYDDEQIMQEARARAQNIARGYQQTTQSIEDQVNEVQQKAAVSEPAHAAADAFFLGVGAPAIEGVLTKGMEKIGLTQAARAAAKAPSTVGRIASHVKTGALIGAPGMGLQGAIEHGVQAAAENKTPDEIGRALVSGGMKGVKEGALGGAIIGGAAGVLEAGVGAAVKPAIKKQFREARAQAELDDARLRGWQEFNENQRKLVLKNEEARRKSIIQSGETFKPHESRVPLEGDPAELATTIIQQKHGEDAALSEVGLRAASQIADRIRLYQDANEALSPKVKLPTEAPIGPQAPVELPIEPNAPIGVQTPTERPGLPRMAELEGTPAPKQVEVPLGIEGVAPRELPLPNLSLGKPLGPIEQGGRPLTPPEEIAPRLGTTEPRLGISPEVPVAAVEPVAKAPEPVTAPVAKVAPEVPVKAAPQVSSMEPGTRVLPTKAQQAVGELNVGKHAVLKEEEGALHLERLGLPAGEVAKPGEVGATLDKVVQKADEHQLPVVTRITQTAGPRGGKIPLEKLIPWYEQRGFKVVESTKLPEGQLATATLRRDPKPPPVKKIGMLEANQAMMDRIIADPKTPVEKNLAAPATTPAPGRWHQSNLWADSNIASAHERIKAREAEFPEGERKKAREAGFIGEKAGYRDPTSYDWADFADRVQIGVNMILKHGLNKTEWIEHMVRELGGKFRDIAEKVYQESVAGYHARRPKGIDDVRKVVDDYTHQAGLGRGATRHDFYPEVNEKFAARVATAYHLMDNVKKDSKAWKEAEQSYAALNHEIELQYQAMEKAGYKITITTDDPYPTSADMRADVGQNKHIKAYKTGEGFHPFMTPEQNDKLRAVHDFFGHASEGYEFGPRGEDAAFQKHASTMSSKAIPALATETRGQNSWVNYWPANAKKAPKDRPFAEQKFGLLPEWVYEDVLTRRATRAPTSKLSEGLLSMGPRGDTRMMLTASEKLSRGIRPVKTSAAVKARFTADGTDTINEMMRVNPESATWYHDDIEKMHKMTEEEIPELANPGHRALFDLLLGFTSPNTNVPQNYARAVVLMKDYLRSGKIPFVQRFGQEVNIGSRNWVPRLNKLIETNGGDLEKMRDYLLTKDPQTNVYNAEKEFGDKVGPFTLNIQGIHDQITVDVWMVRRLRRIAGTLYKTEDGKRVLNEDWVPTAQERRDIEESIRELSKKTKLDPDAVQATLWDNEKMIWERAGLAAPRIPFSLAAEGVLKNMKKRGEEIASKHREPTQTALELEKK